MAKIRQELLEQEKFTNMIMQEHMEDILCIGVVNQLVLENTEHLKEEDIPAILSFFSLSKLPDFLFLISVEECNYVDSGAPDRDVFLVKEPIKLVIQRILDEQGYESITCSLWNTDRIVALLGRPAEERQDVSARELQELAEYMIEQVHQDTGGEIAITISQRCLALSSYPEAYNTCREAYDMLFLEGQKAVQFAGQVPDRGQAQGPIELKQHRADLISAIGSFCKENLYQTISTLVDSLVEANLPASQIKLHLASLMPAVTDYFSTYVLDWQRINSANISTARIILNANYASTVKQAMFRFFQEVVDSLKAICLPKEVQLRLQIDQCFEYLYKDPEFNIVRAAEIIGYNVSYFGKLFKKIYRAKFNSYLSQYRINRSKALLKDTSLPVHLIAEQVGFNNYTYFYTVFKSVLGLTPQQYRGIHRGETVN